MRSLDALRVRNFQPCGGGALNPRPIQSYPSHSAASARSGANAKPTYVQYVGLTASASRASASAASSSMTPQLVASDSVVLPLRSLRPSRHFSIRAFSSAVAAAAARIGIVTFVQACHPTKISQPA